MDKKDHKMLKLLAMGYTQEQVSQLLQQSGFSGASLSSLEKNIKKLCKEHKAFNLLHLVYKLTKRGKL